MRDDGSRTGAAPNEGGSLLVSTYSLAEADRVHVERLLTTASASP
jgi:hypothetical protein